MRSSPERGTGAISPHSDSGGGPTRQLGRSLSDDVDEEGGVEEEERSKPASPPRQKLVRVMSSSSEEEEEESRRLPPLSPPGGQRRTPASKKSGGVTRHYGGAAAQKPAGGKLARALSDDDMSEEENPRAGKGKSGVKPKTELKKGAADGRLKVSASQIGAAGAKKGSETAAGKRPVMVKAGAGKAAPGTRRPVNAAC